MLVFSRMYNQSCTFQSDLIVFMKLVQAQESYPKPYCIHYYQMLIKGHSFHEQPGGKRVMWHYQWSQVLHCPLMAANKAIMFRGSTSFSCQLDKIMGGIGSNANDRQTGQQFLQAHSVELFRLL